MFVTFRHYHTPLIRYRDKPSPKKIVLISTQIALIFLQEKKEKNNPVNAQLFFLVKKLVPPCCMGTSGLVTYTVTTRQPGEIVEESL